MKFGKTKPENNGWTLQKWHGNPALGHSCWAKKFGNGWIYVGAGDFELVCFSFGANSDHSMSSTRWHYGTYISEKDMMAHIDATYTRDKPYVPYPLDPKLYRDWFNGCSKEVQDALLSIGRPWQHLCEDRHNKLMIAAEAM